MLKHITAFLLLLIFSIESNAQYPKNPVASSSTEERIQAVQDRKELRVASNYLGIEATSIGPTVMSGRVVDVAVDPNNTKHFFVAYATGGVWETKNNGHSFHPIFDENEYTIHCGALAVDWQNETIYVGTGEANSSRSSYAGYGLFRCDFGYNDPHKWKLWKHIGLVQVQHISRILIHPTDPNIIYVAAMNSLFSSDTSGGLYTSKDRGETWNKIFSTASPISAVDIELVPEHPDTLLLAVWERSRRGWDFTEGGDGSAIYTSKDAGLSWNRSENFVSGKNVGRIGISIGKDNVVYALLDNQERQPSETKVDEGLTKNSFKSMSEKEFMALDDSTLSAFLKNRLPKIYTAKKLKKMSKKGELTPIDIFNYLHDSNAAMFEDPVNGAELYRSNDLGATWDKTHDLILENVCYSYGYYFGTLHASSSNAEHVFIAGVPLLQSLDGGTTFSYAGGDNVHADHHYISINPNDPLHLINGNDGGINISYDGAQTWTKCNSPAVGQFYTVAVDNQKKYLVYGGLQDNGTWKGPNDYTYSSSWHQVGKYPYQRIGGGDGMQVHIDPRDNTVYMGYQYGHYNYKDADGRNHPIHPKHELREPHLRWNWQTPILLSVHDPDVFYIGSNKLHCSREKYKNFKTISDDLTTGPKPGNVSYGTLSCIAESPLKEGLLYTGSDDGLLHYSANSGKDWTRISDSLPQHLWVKEILPSRHYQNKVYTALNGHAWDNFQSQLFMSDDNGITWRRIGKNLPAEPINTVIEDPNYSHILYLGTDAGVYISTNGGKDFYPLSNLPPVAVHDLAIQEEHRDLIVATHGRSLYKIQLEPVYQSETFRDSLFKLLELPQIKYSESWGKLNYRWETRVPSLSIVFFSELNEPVDIEIRDSEDRVLLTKSISSVKGYNRNDVKLEFQENPSDNLLQGALHKYYLSPGMYTVHLKQNTLLRTQTFLVK